MQNNEQMPNDLLQPDLHKATVGGSYIVVPQHKEFKFKKACPYCGGDITAQADSWEQQDDGSWMADHFDIECQTMPDMDNEEEWNDIQNEHINHSSRIVMEKYHFHKTKAAYEEVITIKTRGVFGPDEMWQLQIALLKFMHQREPEIIDSWKSETHSDDGMPARR
ncbi:MAG: hypothetical protein EOP48_08390 [Sphingobacteriales bacterium]|nr:MAG: hypothetical protein EOP48_08390 [Sphingobacteriales bacterium]